MASEKQDKKSLRNTLKNYSLESTLHGLKPVAEEDGLTTRRLSWIIVLLTATAVMTYLIVSKLIVYYKFPTIIDVGVDYKPQIPFPSVAICNHNPYRLTTLQQYGHFDVVTTAYHKMDLLDSAADRNCTEEEQYLLLDDVCTVPDYTDNADMNLLVGGVTRSVCRHLCTNLRNSKCSGFLYLTHGTSQMCMLTAYTGIPVFGDAHGRHNCQESRATFYRRLRCLTVSSVECTFGPNEDNCHLSAAPEDSIFGKEWKKIKGSSLTPPTKDHTLSMESGHLLALTPRDGRRGVEARLRTPYMDTTGKCLQLFYKHLKIGMSTLEIRTIRENSTYATVFKSTASQGTITDWKPIFRQLPTGIHMIVLRGVREDGVSGIALDDFRILPCEEFEINSIFTPSGSEYMGTASVSSSGKPCLVWTDVKSAYQGREDMFPDESPEKAKNYCRNIRNVYSGPWCVIGPSKEETCDVPFNKECKSGFRCVSTGRCLPAYALCDGEPHCEDGSDEVTPCGFRMSLACEFEEAFKCGYVGTPVNDGFRWTRVEDKTWGQQLFLSVSSSTRYVMKVASEAGTMSGDVAILRSREHTFDQTSLVSFYVKMKVDFDDSDTRLNVHLMTPLGAISETILSINQRGDNIWVKYYLCIPAGTFTLMFEAILGYTNRPVLALDAVSINPGRTTPFSTVYEKLIDYNKLVSEIEDGERDASGPPDVFGPFKKFINQREHIAAVYKTCNLNDSIGSFPHYPFGCSFDEGFCGFESRLESRFYKWRLIPKRFIQESAHNTNMARGCGGDYFDTEGYIDSPGYPIAYDNNMLCEYHIYQPRGSVLTLRLKDIDIEHESECRFDVLTITNGSQWCGFDLPSGPILESQSERVSLSFKSDHSIVGRGFSLFYSTSLLESEDYVIAAAYHGQYNPRVYHSRLSSPSFILNETQCLIFDFFLWERLRVVLTERLEETTPQMEILNANPAFGKAWHRAFVTVYVNEQNMNRRQHVMFHTEHTPPTPSFTAAIDNIKLLPGRCQDQDMPESSVNCTFTHLEQCGYVDISNGPLKWMRAYSENEGYSMACFFDDSKRINSGAVLLSPPLSLTSPACLKFFLRAEGSHVFGSVKLYQDNETIRTLLMFQDDEVEVNNTLVAVELPAGHYRIAFDALGRSAALHLESVQVDSLEDCPVSEMPPVTILPPETNTSISPETTEETPSNQWHPVSDLSPREIRNKTYQHLLGELDISLEDFATLHALPQEDMILECKWDGEDCLPDYVVTETTDMGRCVMFNSITALNRSLQTAKSGAGHGLQLTINTAGYEYVEGLSLDSGIKVEVFSQTKLPNVRDTGFVVGPGMHSVVKVDHTLYKYLSDPYGRCGTKELKHYPNTAYTYPACQRDCATTKLEAKCECHDLYMPGGSSPVCSVPDYLDCVMHREKEMYQSSTISEGYTPECDACPAACSNSEYNVQMSYASISTSGIDGLLADKKGKVTKDFHTAKTTKQRITNEHVYKTLNTMKTLIDDLVLLRDYVTVDGLDPSTSIFSRVEDGIERIVEDAISDLNHTIYGTLPKWIQTYAKALRPGRKSLLNIIVDSKRVIEYLSEMLIWQTGSDSPVVDKRIKYENMVNTCKDVSSNLLRAAMALNDFDAYFGSLPTVDPQQFAAVDEGLLPVNLMFDKDDTTECDALTNKVTSIAGLASGYMDVLVFYLEDALDEHQNSEDLPPLTDTIPPDEIIATRAAIDVFENVTDILNDCLSEYEQYLQTMNFYLGTIAFPDYKYSDSLSEYGEIANLDAYLRWFQSLYTRYLNGNLDLFGLIKEYQSNRKREVITSLESMRTRIQQAVSSPIKRAILDIQKDMVNYYTVGLTSLARLSSYFRDKAGVVIEPLRTLKIWRQPFASFDNPNILDYYLKADEAEKSLPVYLLAHIEKGAADDIAVYLSKYFSKLINAIDDTDDASLTLLKTLQSSMDEMDSILTSFQDETVVAQDFIGDNILKMDIYFSEIKVTSVDQKAEYDLATFFSDMGGYMGLLLGASVLSFIELLDVFLSYFLKPKPVKNDSNDHKSIKSALKTNGLGYEGPMFHMPPNGRREEEAKTYF